MCSVTYVGEFINGSVADVLPGHYGKVSLDDMQLVGAPVYRLSMIAEAYATKGTSTTSSLHPFLELPCPHYPVGRLQ